ncbi:MAG: ferredoxin--NADP reductase [Pirellulaceae bacterium]|nr:ferredoxin--NADP reductase [Pirellulaceae bacterium]
MALQWISGQIVRKQIWSDGLFTLSINCPGVAKFEPGQFLQVGFSDPVKHLHRPYSVASPHSDTLEFFIVRVDGGELTPRLWDSPEGSSIDVSAKPAGSFTLPHVPESRCLWLIATGTGLAPYVAMLRTPEPWARFEKIVLVHGVRHASDLAYTDEFEAMQASRGAAFKFLQVTSRDQLPGKLSGRTTVKLQDGSLEAAANEKISPDDTAVMLCGNPDMLNEMESMLSDQGLKRQKPKQPGQIIVERYW